jgi:hypothetical protein
MPTNTVAYMSGRKKYQRPQGMLWADNPGIISSGKRIPEGYEVLANSGSETSLSLLDQFIILSDDNRSALDFKTTRIEKRERMINGRMRSYHIADKLSLNTSWSLLPSRSFALSPEFSTSGVPVISGNDNKYTTDGGAGGAEILDWYENHKGSFWVYLSYDKRTNFGDDNASYDHLSEYSQVVEMFISDFSYSVQKRGGSNHDLWNISISLEEV